MMQYQEARVEKFYKFLLFYNSVECIFNLWNACATVHTKVSRPRFIKQQEASKRVHHSTSGIPRVDEKSRTKGQKTVEEISMHYQSVREPIRGEHMWRR